MAFYRGQKITPIRDEPWSDVFSGDDDKPAWPKFGTVYVVADMTAIMGIPAIQLAEFPAGVWHDALAFRPVVSKNTSAEVEKLKRFFDPKNQDLLWESEFPPQAFV